MSQNAGGSAPAGGSTMEMLRPETIRTIPTSILNDQEKQMYHAGFTKLWDTVKNNPADSEIHQKAINKIKEASREVYLRMARRKNQAAQQAQQAQQAQLAQANGQQNGAQAGQQQQNGQQNGQVQNAPQGQSIQSTAQVHPQVQAQVNQPAQSTQQSTQPGQAGPQASQQQGQPQSAQQGPQQSAQQNPPRLTAQAENFLRTFEVYPQPGMVHQSPEYATYRTRVLGTLQRCLALSDRYTITMKELDSQDLASKQAGQPIPPERIQQRDQYKAMITKAKAEFDRTKTENEKNKQIWAKQKLGQQAVASGQDATAARVGGPTQAGPQGSTAPNAQQRPGSQMQSGQMPLQQTAQNQAVAQTQQAQPQVRPQPVPQQQQAGHPQALSHQAAISAINRTYSDQVPNSASVPPPAPRSQTSAGTPAGSQPTSAQPFATGPPSASISSTRMAIPPKLNTTPITPVQMPPARPTLGTGPQGMIGQPGIQKPPSFTLEGDEGRALSKKKLDELVRQVTGGGEGLTPEVEEAVLSLADDFIDSVLTSACRLAKIRPNSTLDIRDVQIVLERNYNIRVPGYSLDEVRTVRKFQPASGWTQKMNAVQAAKVMTKQDT